MIRRVTPLCQARCRESEYPRELVYSLLGFASSPQQPDRVSYLCATLQAFAQLNPQILQNHLATMRAVPYFHRAECFFQGRLVSGGEMVLNLRY